MKLRYNTHGCELTTASNILNISLLNHDALSSFVFSFFMYDSILWVICQKNNNSARAILKWFFLSGGPGFVVNHTKDGKMYFSIMAILA